MAYISSSNKNARCLSLAVLILFQISAAALNVVDFGAKPDGRSDSTAAFAAAWGQACSSLTPSTLFVPRGRFVIRSITFTGPCKSRVTVWMDGSTIFAPPDYKLLQNGKSLITFYEVNGLVVRGGTINARGKPFWACRRAGECSLGATTLGLAFCKDVEVRGVTLLNSQEIHLQVFQCNNTRLRGLKIRAAGGSPNTDGIHLSNSNGVAIKNCQIHTGDDCISIGPSNSNFNIQNINCGPGHGISIGSLAESYNEGGVENIRVKGVVFQKTENGVRIKTWGRPSTSYVKNVVFSNIVVKNAQNPVVIDQRYCPGGHCPHGNSGVKISDVTFRNITGTSSSKVAVSIYCSPSNPCTGINLQDINLSYSTSGQPAASFCSNALGSSSGVVVPQSCLS